MTDQPRYPIYVISKGRAEVCLTSRFLIRDGVPFRLVVEPQEEEAYRANGYGDHLLVAPEAFSARGEGSIPVRNWVWEHSIAEGHARHWIVDDNIRYVKRFVRGHFLPCNSSFAWRVVEDFTDRYENIAIAGMNYEMFVTRETRKPLVTNVHVYSNLLIRNDLEVRWRGRYNEDTDLCLQVLSAGLCTVAFNAFVVHKVPTMTTKGGNEDIYRGDGRLKMARSLERQWPYVVSVDRRFQRPQHVVRGSWRAFDTKLIRRTDIDWDALPAVDEFGMVLQKRKPEIKSPAIRAIYEASQAVVEAVRSRKDREDP